MFSSGFDVVGRPGCCQTERRPILRKTVYTTTRHFLSTQLASTFQRYVGFFSNKENHVDPL
jgi:hypothetical protein